MDTLNVNVPEEEATATVDRGVACCVDTNSLQCSEVVHGFSRPCYDIPIRGDIDAVMQEWYACGGAVGDAEEL